MSWRKARMAMWVVMTPVVVLGALRGDIDWPATITLLGMGGFDGAVYAAKSPSKDGDKP